ncbi:NAD(P)H-hydrate dehydratase [Candidatus Woesearchaeota archaeon]|nr:NAD(P)H-hydrate dehydratase [Candidatus Woesearchaeota archaeon]
MHFITKSQIKLPKRRKDSHKGDNGLVLVVGGSKDFVGAVALAGLAALRSGTDLVKIIAPEKVAWAINAYSPDLVTMKLKGDYFKSSHFNIIKNLMDKFDVLLIGNGIGLGNDTKKFCKKTVKSIKKLKVIDADAVKSISMDDAENSIITPHSKELEYFLYNSHINKSSIKNINNEKNIIKKSQFIKKATQEFLDKNNIILLKGRIDVIISKDKIFYNKTGNAGMTKGGTGDVLAGLCAGFLAQSKDLLQSAINAAYFNGLVGDILMKKKKGFTYLASDMVGEIKRIRFNNQRLSQI